MEREVKINKKELDYISNKICKIKEEISKIIVGQDEVVDKLLCALISRGHVIMEGVPGIAKTLLVKTMAEVTNTSVKRIQFTVDMLPTDIFGLTIYRGKDFDVIKGPIFANFVIADEINRAPPKTQSALLESMQERQVTIGKKTFPLPDPFFVMATMNPLESVGVYSLPEAQNDRFLFKLKVGYPSIEEERLILDQNADTKKFQDFKLKKVISVKDILYFQRKVKEVYVSESIRDYIIRIVDYTRSRKTKHSKFIEWGASPRASIAFFVAGKAKALMNGRDYVTADDIKKVALEILRHRIILGYEAETSNITPDKIITEMMNDISVVS